MDKAGELIALGVVGVVAIVVAVRAGWWWWQRKRLGDTERWQQT